MGDGPPGNLPAGLDAYAGYTDNSGIGVTFPAVVARFPAARHLSISVHGQAPAMCGDVEQGALASWAGYDYGYCAVSNVGSLIVRDGRPRRLWVAHYTETPHTCTSARCWPSSPVAWQADGTQWTTHGNTWDESLLADNFFADPPPTVPAAGQEANLYSIALAPDGVRKDLLFIKPDQTVWHAWAADGNLMHLSAAEPLGGLAVAVEAGWDKNGFLVVVVHGTTNFLYQRVANAGGWLDKGWAAIPGVTLHPQIAGTPGTPGPAGPAGTPGPPGKAYDDTVLRAWVGVLAAKVTQAAKALSG